jgi:hypothetical protein
MLFDYPICHRDETGPLLVLEKGSKILALLPHIPIPVFTDTRLYPADYIHVP